MSLIANFNLDSLSVSTKRELIAELKAAIKVDKDVARSLRMLNRAHKAQERADKRSARIAALEAKLEALRNPVGAKAIKANKKPGKVTVVKA